MDSVGVNPHTHDQSNKVVTNKAKSLSPESIESSKMRLFLSLEIIHITQCVTRFQTFEECFPNQFLQPANKLITLLYLELARQLKLGECLLKWKWISITHLFTYKAF